ncbi:hypothetical protein, partial [Xylella fastidiosa]|uniref:hypothetical protein n=1 Tax=Xylella fastidiosa TaxID=2371 RepID=UPI001ED8FE3C
ARSHCNVQRVVLSVCDSGSSVGFLLDSQGIGSIVGVTISTSFPELIRLSTSVRSLRLTGRLSRYRKSR